MAGEAGFPSPSEKTIDSFCLNVKVRTFREHSKGSLLRHVPILRHRSYHLNMSDQQQDFPLDSILRIDYLDGLRLVPDHSIDLLLTDPPYGAIILTATQPFATDVINANRRRFRYDLVWVRTAPVGFLNARHAPRTARAYSRFLWITSYLSPSNGTW